MVVKSSSSRTAVASLRGLCYIFSMKTRAVQFGPVLGNLGANLDYHRRSIRRAVDDGVDLIVFPELSLSGYHLKDIVFEAALRPDGPEVEELKALSREIDILVGGPYEAEPGLIFNSALVFSGGDMLHRHDKVQLPNFGMFEERMIFKPGRTFQSFTIKGLRLGILICREILFPVYAYLYFLQHVDFLIGISNSPHRGLGKAHFASLELWETMGRVFSVFYHLPYVFVNRIGFEDGMGFPGGSFHAEPGRGIVSRAPLFTEGVLDFEINPGDHRGARLAGNYLRDEDPRIVLDELQRILHA